MVHDFSYIHKWTFLINFRYFFVDTDIECFLIIVRLVILPRRIEICISVDRKETQMNKIDKFQFQVPAFIENVCAVCLCVSQFIRLQIN